MPSSSRPDRLVVDANPILSALLGGKARRLFWDAGIRELAAAEVVIDQVRSHVPSMAVKLGTRVALLEYALELLPLRCYAHATYLRTVPEARRRIAHRDPDDVDVLALALHLQIPVWSNDRDFEGVGVEQFTTARLLAAFFGHQRS